MLVVIGIAGISRVGYTLRTSNFGSAEGRNELFGIGPRWTVLRRPFTGIPVPNFYLRWVYTWHPWFR
jgi:hypothetical protein